MNDAKTINTLMDENMVEVQNKLRQNEEWFRVRNILEFKNWIDPINDDVHIVLRAEKVHRLNPTDHIGEAAELVTVSIPFDGQELEDLLSSISAFQGYLDHQKNPATALALTKLRKKITEHLKMFP